MTPLIQSRLKEFLHYVPETGTFLWRVDRNCVKIGDVAGFVDKDEGYRWIKLERKIYNAGILAWLYVTGELVASGEIDHINHVRDCNIFTNLRKVKLREQAKNHSMHSDNTSGHTGIRIYESKTRGTRYSPFIGVEGKQIWLGICDTLEDALVKRKDAENEYGYHPNHGK